MRVNRIIIIIVIISSCIVGYSKFFLVAQETESKVTELSETEAEKISRYFTEIYRDMIVSTTRDFQSDFKDVYDVKSLKKLFKLCSGNVLNATTIYGWKEARVVYLGEETSYAINSDNIPSSTGVESRVVNSIRNNKELHLESDNSNHMVGVDLFNNMGIKNHKVLQGCIECHNRLLERDDVGIQHIKGALLFEIPSIN